MCPVREDCSHSEIQMRTEYKWGSMAAKYFCGNAYPEHAAKNTSRVRPPLALAFALFSCMPGENICELLEWNLILKII